VTQSYVTGDIRVLFCLLPFLGILSRDTPKPPNEKIEDRRQRAFTKDTFQRADKIIAILENAQDEECVLAAVLAHIAKRDNRKPRSIAFFLAESVPYWGVNRRAIL
jgi:hypothetical protein